MTWRPPETTEEREAQSRDDAGRFGPPVFVPHGADLGGWWIAGFDGRGLGADRQPVGSLVFGDGGELTVRTALPEMEHQDWVDVSNLLSASLPQWPASISFPLTLTVHEESLSIPVDGSAVMFRVLATDGWAQAVAQVEGRRVAISCAPDRLSSIGLASLRDTSALPIERFRRPST